MKNKILDKIVDQEIKRQEIIIGEFNFSTELDEEAIGSNIKLGNTGNVKVSIYPETTFRKPHIHIMSSKNNFPNGDAIVYLDKGMMWPHDHHQTILDKNQSIDFDKFMRSPHKNFKNMTNWEYAKKYWNENHDDIKITINIQPDYTKLYKNIDFTNQKKGK